MMPNVRRRIAVLLFIASLSACGTTPMTTCPNDLPATCPSPAPSWATDVQPTMQRTCLQCHAAGQNAPTLVTWDQVHAQRTTMLRQVFSCRMPQADGGVTLTATERAAMLGWLVCDAPQN